MESWLTPTSPSQINHFNSLQTPQPNAYVCLTIQVPKDIVSAKSELKSLLQSMLAAVDEAPLTRRQKLKLYSLGICPRFWLRSIGEFPMTWIERHLEALAMRYLKKWSVMTRPTNPNILHIPKAEGGRNIPAISTLYKKLQVTKQCQLLTSSDPTVRHLAEKKLESEMALLGRNKPALVVQQVMAEDPSSNRRALSMAARSRIT